MIDILSNIIGITCIIVLFIIVHILNRKLKLEKEKYSIEIEKLNLELDTLKQNRFFKRRS